MLGVRGVLHLWHRHGRILYAEVGDVRGVTTQIGHERVVRVEHQAGGRRQRGDDTRPPIGDRIELAVTVELIAEQVREEDRARL